MAYLILPLSNWGQVKYGTDCHYYPHKKLIRNIKSTPLALASFSLPTRSLFAMTTSSRRFEAFLLLNLFDAMFQSAQFIFFDIYLPPLMDFCLRLKIHI